MRNQWAASVLCCALVLGVSSGVWSDVVIGKEAPDFTGLGSDGHTYSLAGLRGKFVVLEWYNKDCPFVRKQYDSRRMQNLQQHYTGKGVVWLSVISSASGKQGYLTADGASADRVKKGIHSTATLLDPEGKIGRLYTAKTTPHMFIIDPAGKLIYKGAIDDRNSADLEDIQGAKNYVELALEEALAGKPISIPGTKPYGCSVKY